MAVPVAVGLLLGRVDAGFLIGLGAVLLVGGTSNDAVSGGSPALHLVAMALPALVAVAAATLIAALPLPDPALILLVGGAALSVNYSRPLAAAAIRFNIYCVRGFTLVEGSAAHRTSAALIFSCGALWNIGLRLMLDYRRRGEPAPPHPARRQPTSNQRRAHFRKQLRSLTGWQFPMRLAIGLALASMVRHADPAHHFGWTLLTVALLTENAVAH
ncbi:hypothetical protein [Sphingomonas sp. TDK1]|uniref:hypothetical protein n=1 Tax=Sphingomonas sp. TDK1 TaxID=453247 RepID=UPI000AA64A9B|nr:hypothetical protein [Sphingomonas sp. TDK1]